MCPVALSHWLRPLEKGVLLDQGRLRELVEGDTPKGCSKWMLKMDA